MSQQLAPAAPLPAEPTLHVQRSLAGQIKRALLLDDDAYYEVAHGPSPATQGFKFILTFIVFVTLFKLIGAIFGALTAPRLGSLQAHIQEFLVGLPWYQNQVAQAPGFEQQFQQTYNLAWDGIRTLLGQPTVPGVLSGIVSFAITTLFFWVVYTALAHVLARWLGGEATYRQALGAVALSYAPLMLLAVEMWPGAQVPATLMFLLLLVCKYLAVRRAYALTPGYTLVATVGPYLIALVGVLFLALFGLALGLSSIPGVNSLSGQFGSLLGF
jgi:hypothetical protein